MHWGNAHFPQGKCDGAQRHEIICPSPNSTSQLRDWRKVMMFGSQYMMMMINMCNKRDQMVSDYTKKFHTLC